MTTVLMVVVSIWAAACSAAPAPPPTCEGLRELSGPATTVTVDARSCRVTLTVTDPADAETVTVWVYVPVDG